MDAGWSVVVGLSGASGKQFWGILGTVLGLVGASFGPLGGLVGRLLGLLGGFLGPLWCLLAMMTICGSMVLRVAG